MLATRNHLNEALSLLRFSTEQYFLRSAFVLIILWSRLMIGQPGGVLVCDGTFDK
jgi:hypothetical protein